MNAFKSYYLLILVFPAILLLGCNEKQIEEGFAFENLTEEEMISAVENFAGFMLEVVPLATPGHIVRANSPILAYQDQIKKDPRLTPKMATFYDRIESEREKILGFIDAGDENNVFAVPASAVRYKLKQSFGNQ